MFLQQPPALARELAKRLGVPSKLTCFDGAGNAFEAMKAGLVDIVFLAIEPVRAAINYGNSVLAQKGPDGEPRGASADLSRELARRLGVPLEYVTFTAAGKAFEAAKENKVDVLFVAIEPVRAAEVEFTPPYVLIEGAYLVPKDSPWREPADLDRLRHG